MTEFKFGGARDDARETYNIESHKGAKGKFTTGELTDRATRDVTYRDGLEGGGAAPSEPVAHDKTSRLNFVLAFVFGVVFITVILVLVIFIPNPTKTQAHVFSVVLALAAGAFASVLSGMLNVRLKFGKRLAIGATGALAVFVIVYFFMPAF
jgi:VIT1/CCC1 family predicted Fe2+/Mn2+ transporter